MRNEEMEKNGLKNSLVPARPLLPACLLFSASLLPSYYSQVSELVYGSTGNLALAPDRVGRTAALGIMVRM